MGVHLSGVVAAYLCDFREKGRVECCQNRIYMWSVSAVFPGALGRVNIDPVMGKHPLEFSFNRIFPSFGDPYILKANNGGPLLENLVYFLLTLLVLVGTHIP